MASTEAPFSATFKINSPEGLELLVTVRPNITTAEEQFEALAEIDELGKQLKAAGFSPAAGYGGGRSSGGGSSAPAAVDPKAGSCNCGIPRVVKSGNGKKGPWTGYFCKNRQCDVKWAE